MRLLFNQQEYEFFRWNIVQSIRRKFQFLSKQFHELMVTNPWQ